MNSRLADQPARLRALTDLGSTLLVEAGAGTGKTALLAGRVAMLLAAGAQPRHIAAITFTELAASELLARIHDFVNALTAGHVPEELSIALPNGVSPSQRVCLEAALAALDDLTCTTTHGFCYSLVRPYPVEADLDPGAAPMDEAEAQLVFQTTCEEWLRDRLQAETCAGDPLAEFVLEDPDQALVAIDSLATFFRDHRTARAPASQLASSQFQHYLGAVDSFCRWYADVCQREGITETSTADICTALMQMVGPFRSAASGPWGLHELWKCSHPPPSDVLFTKAGTFRAYRAKGKWKEAARRMGGSGATADRLCQEATACYDRVIGTFRLLLPEIAQEMLVLLGGCFEDLCERYSDHKRAAALLDFDDLLYKARDLLRDHVNVREALSCRYKHVLVDEFQDTDPLQAEILFLLCGEGDGNVGWEEHRLRPGQFFTVGDPKQAIFRFRQADIHTYLRARDAIERQFPGNRIEIVANFRSLEPVLDFVNDRFQAPLTDQGQPGFSALASVVGRSSHDHPAVMALDIACPMDKPTASELRELEAERVVRLIEELVGNLEVRVKDQTMPCRAGHIALLAPTGTELWIYESALESGGIPISTQAGKSFFQRQEVQDLIAVARTLATADDTLAFGALMRGPLVGLTEQEMLDILGALPQAQPDSETTPRFWLWTDPDAVLHPVASQTLRILQGLARRAPAAAPFDLLAAAVEELRVRNVLKQRHRMGAERVIANVDLFLEMARPYAARGIREFARAMSQRWAEAEREREGQAAANLDAVQLITIHSAKGLEWPVVIPINTTTQVRGAEGILHRREDDTFHMQLGGIEPTSYGGVRSHEDQELARERVRLWYVACTRARDLLVIPRHEHVPDNAWASVLDLRLSELPALDLTAFAAGPALVVHEAVNQQDQTTFIREAAAIAAAHPKVRWIRPSRAEREESPEQPAVPLEGLVLDSPRSTIHGGALRGCVLHKLMEETLNGTLEEDPRQVAVRAAQLIHQLGGQAHASPDDGPCPDEIASAVLRSLCLPIVRGHRERLIPEYTVLGAAGDDRGLDLTAGIADAVALDEEGRVTLVIDWKSDVCPAEDARAQYRAQMRQYLNALQCSHGALVYVTLGLVDEVHRALAKG